MTFSEALKKFQDHAGVNYPQTQRQAVDAWGALKPYLMHDEISALSTAWSHATAAANADRSELDSVCARIRKARGL